MTGKVFLELMRKEGFALSEMFGETGFDSSEETKGVLIKGKKA